MLTVNLRLNAQAFNLLVKWRFYKIIAQAVVQKIKGSTKTCFNNQVEAYFYFRKIFSKYFDSRINLFSFTKNSVFIPKFRIWNKQMKNEIYSNEGWLLNT